MRWQRGMRCLQSASALQVYFPLGSIVSSSGVDVLVGPLALLGMCVYFSVLLSGHWLASALRPDPNTYFDMYAWESSDWKTVVRFQGEFIGRDEYQYFYVR